MFYLDNAKCREKALKAWMEYHQLQRIKQRQSERSFAFENSKKLNNFFNMWKRKTLAAKSARAVIQTSKEASVARAFSQWRRKTGVNFERRDTLCKWVLKKFWSRWESLHCDLVAEKDMLEVANAYHKGRSVKIVQSYLHQLKVKLESLHELEGRFQPCSLKRSFFLTWANGKEEGTSVSLFDY